VIDNPHSTGMIIGYVSDARIAYVTDIWSPGPRRCPRSDAAARRARRRRE